MRSDLVERLNERTFKRVDFVDDRKVMVPCLGGHPAAEECLINPDGPEAATEIERLREALTEARPYVEQAGFRHHDVSELLARIDAALTEGKK